MRTRNVWSSWVLPFAVVLGGIAQPSPVLFGQDAPNAARRNTAARDSADRGQTTEAGETKDKDMESLKKATLGGGCFWCTEAVFLRLEGVHQVESGYSGGRVPNPTYAMVTTGLTGHAEVIQVTYDPEVISYRDLLLVFFATHDPTSLNRQGNDVGTQYRSVIFYHDDEQRKVAEETKQTLNESRQYRGRIVTEIVPFREFYKAEDYHQDYFNRNPDNFYCQVTIPPKLKKLQRMFPEKVKSRRPNADDR